MTDHVCYNGWVFEDSSRTTRIPCPDCQRERTNEARDGVVEEINGKETRVSLANKLGLDKKFATDTYNPQYIIGNADIHYMDKTTLTEFNEKAEYIINNLVMSTLPKTSIIMYLGRHAKLQEFAYILLASAHKGVFDVGRMITSRYISVNKHKDSFQEFYEHDLSVVIVTSEGSTREYLEVQGYMQERAYNNKPTIILLSSRRNFLHMLGRLCSLDEPRLDLGAYLGVSYREDVTEQDNILVSKKALQVSNEALGTQTTLDNHIDVNRYLDKKEEESKETEKPFKANTNVPEFDMGAYTNNNFNGRGS